MRALVFLFLLLLSLNLKAQYNKDAKHAIRLTPTFSGYHGLSLEAAYEYFIKPKHSVVFGLESTYRTASNFGSRYQNVSLNIGYRYNFLNWKRLEMFAGIDLRNGFSNYSYISNREHKNFISTKSSINTVFEANYNINKNFSLFGKVSLDIIRCDQCYFINNIGLGSKYKF